VCPPALLVNERPYGEMLSSVFSGLHDAVTVNDF
jgi:hypothetical protein